MVGKFWLAKLKIEGKVLARQTRLEERWLTAHSSQSGQGQKYRVKTFLIRINDWLEDVLKPSRYKESESDLRPR